MRRTFTASLDQLYSMLAFIRERSIAAGLEPLHIARIELACEEALVNIISYAYPDQPGSVEILCNSPDRPGIKISLLDDGIPHDPLGPHQAPKEDQLGGYGIPLIVAIMDHVQYQREQNRNVLTLVKYAQGRG